jgi:hypothetical protein
VAVVNGSRDSLTFDGMADAEVERRMKVCSFPAPVLTSCYMNLQNHHKV